MPLIDVYRTIDHNHDGHEFNSEIPADYSVHRITLNDMPNILAFADELPLSAFHPAPRSFAMRDDDGNLTAETYGIRHASLSAELITYPLTITIDNDTLIAQLETTEAHLPSPRTVSPRTVSPRTDPALAVLAALPYADTITIRDHNGHTRFHAYSDAHPYNVPIAISRAVCLHSLGYLAHFNPSDGQAPTRLLPAAAAPLSAEHEQQPLFPTYGENENYGYLSLHNFDLANEPYTLCPSLPEPAPCNL